MVNPFPRREPKGISTGGRFAFGTRNESNVSLTPGPELLLAKDKFRPSDARLPDTRPEGSSISEVAWGNYIAGRVCAGPISRGVVNEQRREAFRSWHAWASDKGNSDPRYYDFALGLRTGVSALYERRMPFYSPIFNKDRFDGFTTPTYVADSAVTISGQKRVSHEDRENWEMVLSVVPTEEIRRGHLAAGVILSGQDEYWGMREDPDATVTAASKLY